MKRNPFPRRSLFGALILVALEVLLYLRIPVVREFFYILVWWPYIILVDGAVYRYSGWSLIKERPSAFLWLLPWSVTFWLIFELINLRLDNWHYIGLPVETWIRWPGYVLAFATVLPGLLETYLLLNAVGTFRHLKIRGFQHLTPQSTVLMAWGVLFLILPMIWPRYFFPLVWGGLFLIFDPLNYRLKGSSLLGDLKATTPSRILNMLMAGLICGFLWEFWNYWATSKWIYTVPYVGNIKLFEMPVLGFLGFPPFALECYAMYQFLVTLNMVPAWDPYAEKGAPRADRKTNDRWKLPGPSRACMAAQMVGHIPFWLLCFQLMDHHTVLSFR